MSQKKRFDGNPGDTLWFHEMYQEIPHLYVVVTPPVGTPPLAVIVNLTSQRAHSDTTVILQQGDHPFLKGPTAVNYKYARLLSIEWLKKEIDAKIAWADVPFKADVLKRIQAGVLESPFTPHNIKKHFAKAVGLSPTKAG